jgi:hypothetical protein
MEIFETNLKLVKFVMNYFITNLQNIKKEYQNIFNNFIVQNKNELMIKNKLKIVLDKLEDINNVSVLRLIFRNIITKIDKINTKLETNKIIDISQLEEFNKTLTIYIPNFNCLLKCMQLDSTHINLIQLNTFNETIIELTMNLSNLNYFLNEIIKYLTIDMEVDLTKQLNNLTIKLGRSF